MNFKYNNIEIKLPFKRSNPMYGWDNLILTLIYLWVNENDIDKSNSVIAKNLGYSKSIVTTILRDIDKHFNDGNFIKEESKIYEKKNIRRCRDNFDLAKILATYYCNIDNILSKQKGLEEFIKDFEKKKESLFNLILNSLNKSKIHYKNLMKNEEEIKKFKEKKDKIIMSLIDLNNDIIFSAIIRLSKNIDYYNLEKNIWGLIRSLDLLREAQYLNESITKLPEKELRNFVKSMYQRDNDLLISEMITQIERNKIDL